MAQRLAGGIAGQQDAFDACPEADARRGRPTHLRGQTVVPPSPEERILRTELVEMGTKVLVLVITEHGQVLSRMVERPDALGRGEIESLSRRLSEDICPRVVGRADSEGTSDSATSGQASS